MEKALIIVESPTKIKTLQKFLGKNFVFASSLGHIRDLPQKGFGIDIENDFEPQYEMLPEKKEVVQELKKLAKECDVVYLSPDPDREGEAIAWHIAHLLPKNTKIKRAAFHAITKEAVTAAIENPKEIDIALVNAQQARRLLDRIVGYKISPILARKLMQRSGVSAGRVQSVALKLVVDREKEIEAFVPVEYWNIGALLKNAKEFSTRLYSIDGKRWEKEPVEGKDLALIPNQQTAETIVDKLNRASYKIAKVDKKEKKRNPEVPFITSTLQQEASRHFRFSPSKTMQIAQSLYEGIDLKKEGTEGLITYMRTDSVRSAPEAVHAARDYIKSKFGDTFLPSSPRMYKSKKSAQDAHEAIRPTNLNHPPEMVKPYLNHDQFRLYSLVWKRFIASQMNPAIYDTVTADIDTDQDIVMRATGSVLKFNGFLRVYEEKQDDVGVEDDKMLPPLKEGEPVSLIEVTSDQSFTKPPPRFTEASLVRALEKSGIGRPSTYASIMNKIHSRAYTTKENMRLRPTELGCVIAQFLEDNFEQIMNVSFTSEMEDTLELVAANEKEWKAVIREFWEKFIPTVETAEKEAFIPKIDTDIECPKCKETHLQKIWSKSGYFYGCARYPDCDYTASLDALTFSKEDYDPNFDWEQPCPICSDPMQLRHGKYGAFLGCKKYPKCKGIVNIPKIGEKAGPQEPCPAIGCNGIVTGRQSRFGKTFYSCSNYPDCDVIVNEISQLEKKYADHPKTPYQKKAKGLGPSKELAAVIGEDRLSRGDATKKLWVYIKSNNLQDPNDKRQIVPDDKLAKVFGTTESVSMFQIAKFLAQHLSK